MGTSFNNPVYSEYLADPFCWFHEGMYYAVGTGKEETGKNNLKQAVPMIKSKDLFHWSEVGRVLIPPNDLIGGCYWAPEVVFEKGLFYMYYHPNGAGGHHIRVAISNNPEGPYIDENLPLTDLKTTPFAIDSHAFKDSDGQWYLFYATDFQDEDETTFRGTALVMDRLIDMVRLEGRPQTVMRAHWPWQLYKKYRDMYGKGSDWYTLEGPTVIYRHGRYYCFYSGGCYQNDSYGVDYLVADKITGPWTEIGKEKGPQVVRTIPGKVIGPGHNSIVTSPDGKDFMVYHAWDEKMEKRQMCVDPLEWESGTPVISRFKDYIRSKNQNLP